MARSSRRRSPPPDHPDGKSAAQPADHHHLSKREDLYMGLLLVIGGLSIVYIGSSLHSEAGAFFKHSPGYQENSSRAERAR